jgi:D-alanyl-D-alanine dipeptidase
MKETISVSWDLPDVNGFVQILKSSSNHMQGSAIDITLDVAVAVAVGIGIVLAVDISWQTLFIDEFP